MGIMMNDKRINYLYGPAQTKQQVGYCIIWTLLIHRQNTNSQNSSWPKLGGNHHLPLYNILYD
jgi:hypothetical protein